MRDIRKTYYPYEKSCNSTSQRALRFNILNSSMAFLCGWRKTLFCGFAFSSLVAAWGHGNFDQKLDRSWKRYRNPEFGYCVSIPSRWAKGEAFEGAGLYVQSGMRKTSRPLGVIDFEAIASAPMSLAADLQDHLAVLQKFERAERM